MAKAVKLLKRSDVDLMLAQQIEFLVEWENGTRVQFFMPTYKGFDAVAARNGIERNLLIGVKTFLNRKQIDQRSYRVGSSKARKADSAKHGDVKEKRRCVNCNKQVERGNTVSGWYHTNPNPDCTGAAVKPQIVCAMNDQHEGTKYRCESSGTPYFLCEACIESERMALCEQCNLMCEEESMNCEGPVPICQTCAKANVALKVAEYSAGIEAAKKAYAKAIVLDIPDNDQHALNEAIGALPMDMDNDLAVAIGYLMVNSAGDPTDAAIHNVFANVRVR